LPDALNREKKSKPTGVNQAKSARSKTAATTFCFGPDALTATTMRPVRKRNLLPTPKGSVLGVW